MNTQLPGNLAEIFPLRFRLRDQLRFVRGDGTLIVERVSRSQRYSLKSWQFELLHRFDGKRTFEELSKEVYTLEPGGFTAMGLLNFYNWLYDENLVLCECESVFELCIDDSGANDEYHPRLSSFGHRLLRNSGVRRVLQASVILVFFLSVLRIAYVVAPIFEPPVERLSEIASTFLKSQGESVSLAKSERSVQVSSVEKVELATKVVPVEAPKPKPETLPTPTPKKQAETAVALEVAPAPVPDRKPIEILRTELEECRIRRDEFYLQDNEEGYRHEVQRMSNLVKEIGDIENSL